MARARMYELIGSPKEPFKGQAAVVFDAMLEHVGTPKLATELAASPIVAERLKTRQDVLRVVLYYILVFKSKGLVRATEQPVIDAETVEAEAAATE